MGAARERPYVNCVDFLWWLLFIVWVYVKTGRGCCVDGVYVDVMMVCEWECLDVVVGMCCASTCDVSRHSDIC
jgi:hypothetical protein